MPENKHTLFLIWYCAVISVGKYFFRYLNKIIENWCHHVVLTYSHRYNYLRLKLKQLWTIFSVYLASCRFLFHLICYFKYTYTYALSTIDPQFVSIFQNKKIKRIKCYVCHVNCHIPVCHITCHILVLVYHVTCHITCYIHFFI